MIKTILSLILMLSFGVLQPHLLGDPNPASPYKFTFGTKSEEIERELSTKQTFYKDIQWSDVELSVNENNIEVNKNIAKIDADMQTLYSQLRKLRLAANLKQIEQNLIALQTARKSIIQTTETQLQAINYQGLYLAIHDKVSPLDKEEVLVNDMRTVIAPMAIATANGVFTQNITALRNNTVEYDYIREKVSGSMEPINSLYTDANKNEGYFLQIRQEKIFPLQKAVKAGGNNPPSSTNIKVIDLYNNDNYSQDLNQMLPDVDLRSRVLNNWLTPRLAEFKKAMEKYNASSRSAEANIATETQKQLYDIDLEIKSAQQELDSKRLETQKILQGIGVANCALDQLLSCIASAEQKIAASMKQLEAEKLAEKEKELIAQIFDVSGQGGDPSKAIASETYQKVLTLNNSNTTVKSFLQELTITNGTVSSYGSAASSDLFRTVQYFWMYPMTTNQNGYKVGVVLRFKMGNVKSNSVNASFSNSTCDFIEMVDIPGGTFMMGSNDNDDEKPIHSVTLNPFSMGKYEVTQKQWVSIMGTSTILNAPHSFKGDNLPIENVSWNDIQIFLQKLNAIYPNCNYRLPTEAEWEYAARAGQNLVYSGSSNIEEVAWYSNNSGGRKSPVGQKKPNAYGLYDMSGNVWEWCQDYYDAEFYTKSEKKNPMNSVNSKYRVLRGGSWDLDDGSCHVFNRYGSNSDVHVYDFGFRLVR